MSAQLVPQSILDQAIAWAVRLQSGAASAEERAACAAWRAAAAAHERAWQEVEAVDRMFRSLPPSSEQIASRTLQASGQGRLASRRRALKLLGGGALAIAAGLLAVRNIPWEMREAHATAVGQRRRMVLADGTVLHLNTSTDLDLVFTPLKRLIVLRQGEIAIETGRDADALAGRRPFWVQTAHAQLEALGTRFVVRQSAEETRVHVSEGAVAIHGAGASHVVRAGEAARVALPARLPQRVIDPTFDPAGWTDGVIVAKQMRLDAFVAELSRYSAAAVRCDAAAAELRVSGVFQLEGADPVGRALDVLAQTLPVRAIPGPGEILTVTRN